MMNTLIISIIVLVGLVVGFYLLWRRINLCVAELREGIVKGQYRTDAALERVRMDFNHYAEKPSCKLG